MQEHFEILVGAAIGTAKFLTPSLAAIGLASTGLINEQTQVPLTIVGVVGGACWYLNGRFTKLEDGQEQLNGKINSLREDLSKRPCGISAICPTTKED
jgi:hypothetical protein